MEKWKCKVCGYIRYHRRGNDRISRSSYKNLPCVRASACRYCRRVDRDFTIVLKFEIVGALNKKQIANRVMSLAEDFTL